MIYFVLIGSSIFTYFISLAKIPEQLIIFLSGVDLPPMGIIVLMLGAYLVLGAVFDELAAMIVTLPFVLPVNRRSLAGSMFEVRCRGFSIVRPSNSELLMSIVPILRTVVYC